MYVVCRLTPFPCTSRPRSSPYGTPKLGGVGGMSRSPVFASPLVADPVSFSALDLDPGAPQVGRGLWQRAGSFKGGAEREGLQRAGGEVEMPPAMQGCPRVAADARHRRGQGPGESAGTGPVEWVALASRHWEGAGREGQGRGTPGRPKRALISWDG